MNFLVLNHGVGATGKITRSRPTKQASESQTHVKSGGSGGQKDDLELQCVLVAIAQVKHGCSLGYVQLNELSENRAQQCGKSAGTFTERTQAFHEGYVVFSVFYEDSPISQVHEISHSDQLCQRERRIHQITQQ